jgi:hypothetical protein
VAVPQGVSIVPCSSSKNEFASARVAQALSRIGITDVWILEGGLDAWVAEGRPTTVTLSTREELAMRLGIVLPSAGLKRHIEGLAETVHSSPQSWLRHRPRILRGRSKVAWQSSRSLLLEISLTKV